MLHKVGLYQSGGPQGRHCVDPPVRGVLPKSATLVPFVSLVVKKIFHHQGH
jgi:hypothetical protein